MTVHFLSLPKTLGIKFHPLFPCTFVIIHYFNFSHLILYSFFSAREFTFSKFWNSSADSQNITMFSTAEVFRQTLLWSCSVSHLSHLNVITHTSGLLEGSGNTQGHLVSCIEDHSETSTTDLSESSLYLPGFFVFSYDRRLRCFINLEAFIQQNFWQYSVCLQEPGILEPAFFRIF